VGSLTSSIIHKSVAFDAKMIAKVPVCILETTANDHLV
jgi:hypothetical protein